jgi:hypothetical protein
LQDFAQVGGYFRTGLTRDVHESFALSALHGPIQANDETIRGRTWQGCDDAHEPVRLVRTGTQGLFDELRNALLQAETRQHFLRKRRPLVLHGAQGIERLQHGRIAALVAGLLRQPDESGVDQALQLRVSLNA